MHRVVLDPAKSVTHWGVVALPFHRSAHRHPGPKLRVVELAKSGPFLATHSAVAIRGLDATELAAQFSPPAQVCGSTVPALCLAVPARGPQFSATQFRENFSKLCLRFTFSSS